MRLWGFQPLPARLGFVELFPEFVGFMGRFVGFVLGFVGFMGCSLIFREVRWICPGFVDFMGCSLDYRFNDFDSFVCSRELFIGLNLCYTVTG